MCNCELCQARKAGVSPLEWSFRNNPEALLYLKRFPGYQPYEYLRAAERSRKYNFEICDETEFKLSEWRNEPSRWTVTDVLMDKMLENFNA